MNSLIFPGQGVQFPGMGKELYNNMPEIRELMQSSNDILGYDIIDIMFNGSEEELKQTKITQPAIFIHSVAAARSYINNTVDMVAGHSLGEFSALVAADVFSFKQGLELVYERAKAMQEACESKESTMAAVLKLEDSLVEQVCMEVSNEQEIVVPANYNCPKQLVISGDISAVKKAGNIFQEKGGKFIPLSVSGAFHSPLMIEAQNKLKEVIENINFNKPIVPIYQNITAEPTKDIDLIKKNLIKQVTGSVKWTQTITNMIKDGSKVFVVAGPGKAVQGLINKINKEVEIISIC